MSDASTKSPAAPGRVFESFDLGHTGKLEPRTLRPLLPGLVLDLQEFAERLSERALLAGLLGEE